eukprot:132444_1
MAFLFSVYILLIHAIYGGVNSAVTHEQYSHHNSQHKTFRYRGWGWTQNFPLLPEIPSGLQYSGPRMITSQCVVTLKNATFNLLPLHLNPRHNNQFKYYSVHDERSKSDLDDDYKYAFNVCGPVLEIPDGCVGEDAPGMYCEDNNLSENGTCNVPLTHVNGSVFAYQMKVDKDGKVDRCWHLSDSVGGPGVWSLVNDDNPSLGVTVSYLDGDYSETCEHNRQINISFICDNDHGAFGIPSEARSEVDYTPYSSIGEVSEDSVCQYKLEFRTVYGCPAQCPIVGTKLCNGVGLCGYDWTIKAPRCYCYSMFRGDSCTQIDMKNLFKPSLDPVTADTSSDYVKQFDHTLIGPGKQEHSVTVTYDLTNFVTPSDKPFILNDVDGITHTYVMSFGSDVIIDPDVVIAGNKTFGDFNCRLHEGYCTDLDGDCTSSRNLVAETGIIYQIDVEKNECVVAGGRNDTWKLYDEDNPARGLEITFRNGDYCKGKHKNRQFRLNLLCPDDSNTYLPVQDETQRIFDAFVEEDDFDFCAYHMTLTTAFACPDECVTDATNTPDIPDDVSVCNTQGMCAADPFSGYVHCLCDDGWTGDYCQLEYHASSSLPFRYRNQGSYVAAIVIISFIMIALCYFGYKKIRSQKQKVKELEIKLVNYQSSGGQVFGVEQHEVEVPQGQSLSDKIKDKFSKNKRGKYANISHNDEEEDEQLFNVKVKMGQPHSTDDDEENDDDAGYNKQKHIIGNDEEDEEEEDEDEDEEDEDDSDKE